MQVSWVLWKRITYCREDFLTPISKYCACYLKKKKKKIITIYSSLERKPWATFHAPVSMGPYAGLTPVCRCLS